MIWLLLTQPRCLFKGTLSNAKADVLSIESDYTVGSAKTRDATFRNTVK